MSTGQMLLVLAALVTFSMVSLTINQSVIISTAASLETEAVDTGRLIADSFIDEACSKPFDAAVAWGQTIEDPSDFTTCGAGGGEKYPNYNDLDDFDSLSDHVVRTDRLGNFKVSMDVYYVDPDHPNYPAGHKTNCKAVLARVTSPHFSINPETGRPAVLTVRTLVTYKFTS